MEEAFRTKISELLLRSKRKTHKKSNIYLNSNDQQYIWNDIKHINLHSNKIETIDFNRNRKYATKIYVLVPFYFHEKFEYTWWKICKFQFIHFYKFESNIP